MSMSARLELSFVVDRRIRREMVLLSVVYCSNMMMRHTSFIRVSATQVLVRPSQAVLYTGVNNYRLQHNTGYKTKVQYSVQETVSYVTAVDGVVEAFINSVLLYYY